MIKESLDYVLEQSIKQQQERLLEKGREVEPNLTPDDVLQPCDFPHLEADGEFRYEEGYLHGLLAAKALYFSWKNADEEKSYFE